MGGLRSSKRDAVQARLPFRDRHEAGRLLGDALQEFRDRDPFVLGLPRGGVPVAYEVARALDAPLDVALVRKLGAPGHPELAVGAVVDGADPQVVLNEEFLRVLRPDPGYLDAEVERQLAELERRRLYRGSRPPPALDGKTVILVDDGIATGSTTKAVLRALPRTEASGAVLAVPVAPRDSLDELATFAERTICLATPEPFYAVGLYYLDFTQTSDEEVLTLLRERASRSP